MPLNNIFDPKTGTLDLSKIDKNKSWLIFYKKTCSGCHIVIDYLKKNNIKYKLFNLDTKKGLMAAAFNGVLGDCMKMTPVILEYYDEEQEF